MKTKIKTIDIQAKEWFDKVNGNSYFAGIITINFGMRDEEIFKLPYQYGYGDHYKYMAKELLVEKGIIKADKMEALWRYCKDHKIILRAYKVENCKKASVKTFN